MTTALAMGDPDDDARKPTIEDIANAATPVDETLWERRWQAVSMRNGGMTFDQIATVQKISAAQVRKDVALAKREIMAEPVEDMVARQRSVLLDLQRAMYPKALGGDTKATTAIIKGLEQEAKLLGLYRPAQVHIGVSDNQFRDRATELILALRPDTLKELTNGRHTIGNQGDPARTEPVDAEVVQLPGTVAGEPSDGGDEPAAGEPAPPTPGPADANAAPEDDGWANL